MKKNIKEILKNITPETPIEEVITYCDTVEDFELIISSLPESESNTGQLSEKMQQAALSLFKTNKLNAAKITTAYIQRNLSVTYSQAAAIFDWLKTSL